MIILQYSSKDIYFHVNESSSCRSREDLELESGKDKSNHTHTAISSARQIINYSTLVNLQQYNQEEGGEETEIKRNIITTETKPPTTIIRVNSPFNFDEILQCLWNNAQTNELFRYIFLSANVPMKVIPGKYHFIAQLNPERALKRRKPQEIQSLNQPFNPNDFHFDKVKIEEKILTLKKMTRNSIDDKEDGSYTSTSDDHTILINVSPLEYGHILLVPSLSQHEPQRITLHGLKLAIELLLLSKSCNFRVGFNSLCGYASVNHHHYHAYYLQHRLFIEYAELKSLAGTACKEIMDYPASGFVFTIDTTTLENLKKELDKFIMNAFKLASYFQDNNIAHNVYITRGSSTCQKGYFDQVRLFIWARSPSYGAKKNEAFNPALCELAGHFPIKNLPSYENLTEELICQTLNEICEDIFLKLKPLVVKLYEGY